MKVLRYNFCTHVNYGTEEEPQWKEILNPVELGWSEEHEKIAQREAYNGEYTIEDDGEFEIPTEEERIEALEAALLEMMGVQVNG